MSKQSTMSWSATLQVPEDMEDSVLFSAPPTPMPTTYEVEPLGPRTRLRSATDRSSKYRIPARRYDSIMSDMSTQFDRKYPPDLYGQEASDNARVWQVYCDESSEHDQAMLEGWNKTLDILLIFAGLFSAVSTAFIIESYRALQPDYTAYTANLLYLVSTAAQSSSTTPPVLPHPEAFTISGADRWTNGLWFMSLVLSLSVALLSILAKQWLDEYRARITGPFQSARYWARRRALFFKGMKVWHLPAFISTLPVLLHLSLFLFLAGLVLFLWTLDTAVACCVLALSGLVLGFYCISVVLPLWQPDCPTRIPLVDQLPRLWARTKSLWRVPASRALAMAASIMERIPKLNFARFSDSVRSLNEKVRAAPPMSNTEVQERKLVDERTAALDASALRWLLRSSPAQDVIAVGVQAIGALPPWSETLNHLRSTEVPNLVRDHVELSFPKVSTLGSFINTEADAARCARYLRSWISIRIERGVYTDSQLLARIVRHPMPNSHDLPLLRFIIRWTLDHYVDSTSFMTVLKKRNVNQRERDGQWVFLPSTVLQGITLVVEHKSNRMHRALSAVLHLFHAGRLWEEPEEDLTYAANQVGALLTAMGDRYVDTSLLSGLEACIDFWSMILNGSAFYQLDDDDVHVAARDLGLLVARHETVRKVTVLPESVPTLEIERSHDFAAFVASPSFLQHGWDLRVLEAMAHSIQRVATLGLSVGHTARALSHLTLAFTRHETNTPEGRAEYDEIMTSFQDIVSAMFTELAFPLRAASDTRHAHSEKHPLLPSAIASTTQETLLYFLRRHNDDPSAWHVLHHAGWTAMSRLIVADALAANLCTMSRRGRDGNELLRLIDEFFSVEFITRDSMSKARSLGTSLQDSVDSFDDNNHMAIQMGEWMYGGDEDGTATEGRKSDVRSHFTELPIPMMPEVVRLAQHCGELRHGWWVRACERILSEIEMEVDDPDPQLRDFVQQLLQMADQPCETC